MTKKSPTSPREPAPSYSRPRLRLAAIGIGPVMFLGLSVVIVVTRSNPRFVLSYAGAVVVVGLAVFAVHMALLARLKRRLRATGGALCPDCGYHIAGVGEAGECPECGRRFSLEADAAYWRRHVQF